MSTATTIPCRTCGAPAATDTLDGFCVDCLFREAAAARKRPAAAPASARPERLGDYEILGDLGRGAMGRVYRARQKRPDRVVALKVVSAWEMGSPDHVERFRIEAEAAARLDHPNIVPLYEVGEQDEWHYFSMRLVEGGTLGQALKNGPLSFDRAARWLAKVARAIQHAHERGVLHRDIKPGNILLDQSGEPHVADFGLAKLAGTESHLTLTSTALGTPAYMAPEQAAGRVKEITTAADVHSLGAVFFEMLAGRPPFLGDTAMAVTQQVIEREAVSPRAIRAGVPGELAVICLKCLEKEPSRRYPTAGALADDLERWLRHEPILAQPATGWERAGKWMRRKPAHAALAGTVVAAVIALVAGLAVHNQRIAAAQRATDAANRELAAQLRRVEWRQAEDMLAAGSTPDGMAMFARFARETPNDTAVAARLRSLLETRAFPLPLLPPLKHDRPVDLARMDEGRHIWTIADGVLRSWNQKNGALENEAALDLGSEALQPVPNSTRLLVTTKSRRVLLWDYEAWRLDRDLGATAPFGEKWSLNADGKLAALVTPEEEIQLIDTTTGQLLARTKTAAKSPQIGGSVGPEGEVIVRGENYGAWVWRPRKGTLTQIVNPDEESPVVIADWPRERVYFTAEPPGLQGIVSLDLATGNELAHNPLHFPWHSIRPSPDGRQLLVSRWGVGATVLDAETLHERFPVIGPSPTFCIVSPEHAFRAGFQATHDGSGRLHDLGNGQTLMEPVQHAGIILKHQLSLDGTRLLTASQDGTARLWDIRMRSADARIAETGHPAKITLSPDGRRVAAAAHSQLRLHDLETRQEVFPPLTAPDHFQEVNFSPDGRLLTAACSDQTVSVIDAGTGKTLWRDASNERRVYMARFSPDGRVVASGGEDGSARLFDAPTGRVLCPPIRHARTVADVTFSPDGRLLATASHDSTARIWDAATGQPASLVFRHQGTVGSARFSPDGRRLATASLDRTAQIWDVATGKPAGPAIGADTGVSQADFDNPGKRLLIRTLTGARLFDATTMRPLTPPMVHGAKQHRVTDARLSPDGRWVATCSEDGTARVWDAWSGFPITEPLRHPSRILNLAWLPGSRQVLTAAWDSAIRQWGLPDARPANPWLAGLAEALAGKRDDRGGGATAVPPDQIEFLRKQSSAATKGTPDDRWLHWFLAARLQLPNSQPEH